MTDIQSPSPSPEGDQITDALVEERSRIERILDRLDVTEDLTERADLGSELVRSASRYEDTLERAVWPVASESVGDALVQLEADREELRDAMTIIHKATMHIDPRNVHASDSQGFEEALGQVSGRLRAILAGEDEVLSQLEQLIDPSEREEIVAQVARAYRHASERPYPPRTPIGRAIANAHVKLDHTFEDVATPTHPGAETIG